MKRWIALLLALVMTVLLAPTAFAAGGSAGPKDLWAEIERIEENAVKGRKTVGAESRAQAYAGAVDRIAAAVEDSADYAPGSLIRNGDVLFWDTVDGQGCGYSPRLRARIRETAVPDADPEAYSGIETVSYGKRGGSPGSVNVAVFQPYYGIDSSFSTQYKTEGQSIAQATGGTSTTYLTNNATIDNIAKAIETCGVVIFDSHGDTDYASGEDYTSRANTSYICLQSGTGITAADQVSVTGPYGSYKHAYYAGGYGSMKYYCVDGTAIANHMDKNAPNSILWMAICLGMATDGLQAPLRAKGVEVAYGYSQSVTFSGDYKWEEYFWTKMKAGSTVKDAIAYMKQKVGNKDPYEYTYPAYPIAVSSEDAYPGHGNVDKVQTVKSTWTLFHQYTVTALSNNDAWGTVSVSGSTITATPAAGYYAAGYEVVSGTATVTQSGNEFQVNAAGDCTVRIIFEAKTPATIHFSVPEGVSCSDISAYLGDEVVLPTPDGTVTAGRYDCHFLGWTTEPVEEHVTAAPTFLRAGTGLKLTGETQTLYALYSYLVPEDGSDGGQYRLVDEAPASWEGEYVITHNGVRALNAGGSITGTSIGGSKAVVVLEEVGVIRDDSALNNVPDELVFQIAPSENGTYTVKMKNSDIYLAVNSNTNMLTTASAVSDKSRWSFSLESGEPVMTNVAYPGRSLQYNASAGLFRGYAIGTQQPLTLYAAEKGTTWFTTAPKDPDVELTAPDITLSNVASTGKVRVSWQAVSGADGYRIYRSASKSGAYTLLETTADLSYVDVSAVAGVTYYYKVCALRGAQVGPESAAVARACDLPRPIVSRTHDAATGKNMLTWETVDGAVSYKVYAAESADGTYKLLQTTGDTRYVHTSGVAGVTYYYKVMAVAEKASANSAYSAVRSLTCDLPRPVVSRDHVASTGKNVLTWDAIDGAVSYRIYCATSKDGDYKLLRTTADTKFIHTAAVAGVTYYYKVMAVAGNAEANSAYSEIRTLTCDLPRPEVTIALSGGGNPKLTWNAVDGAIRYRIYRATAQNGAYSLYYTTDKLSFINSNVETGKTYYYKVVAVAANSEANSAYSAVVSIKVGK